MCEGGYEVQWSWTEAEDATGWKGLWNKARGVADCWVKPRLAPQTEAVRKRRAKEAKRRAGQSIVDEQLVLDRGGTSIGGKVQHMENEYCRSLFKTKRPQTAPGQRAKQDATGQRDVLTAALGETFTPMLIGDFQETVTAAL